MLEGEERVVGGAGGVLPGSEDPDDAARVAGLTGDLGLPSLDPSGESPRKPVFPRSARLLER
ncbi:MAG TPA: hypothetical protein VHK89_03200, partial [Actinomycetota bacterium]|nr:hypothetical protein [Actinomycetota bacterium]